MADKKFGQKRVCPNCEKKFYDLNKKSPFNCLWCEKEIIIEDDNVSFTQNTPIIQQPRKTESKDEFADIENTDNTSEESDDDVISLDDAAIEEEQGSKN